jgi:hypothetical protein
MRRSFHIIILCVFIALTLHSQSFNNAGSTGMQFLKIGTSTRAGGMGGAFGSISGDISSLTINPASIGTIQSLALSVQHTTWVEQTDLNFIGLVVPISDAVNLGLQTTYLTSGNIEITTIDVPEGTGQYYDISDIAMGLTSSVRLTSQLTFALTAKYLQERIFDVSTEGLSMDVGMWYATGFKSLDLGFSITNLGYEMQFTGKSLEVPYVPADPAEPNARAELQTQKFGLPLSFRASGSFDLFEMFDEKLNEHQMITAIDFIQNTDTRERVLIGAEYRYSGTVFLRGGYTFNADELSWSSGVGTFISMSGYDVQFDVSAASLGRFGMHYQVGLAIYAKVK